jgi:hypothetical protein
LAHRYEQPQRPVDQTEAAEQTAKAYAAGSERLKALAEFVARFAPAIGEIRSYGDAVDVDVDPSIVEARDAAVLAAFKGIETISRRDH